MPAPLLALVVGVGFRIREPRVRFDHTLHAMVRKLMPDHPRERSTWVSWHLRMLRTVRHSMSVRSPGKRYPTNCSAKPETFDPVGSERTQLYHVGASDGLAGKCRPYPHDRVCQASRPATPGELGPGAPRKGGRMRWWRRGGTLGSPPLPRTSPRWPMRSGRDGCANPPLGRVFAVSSGGLASRGARLARGRATLVPDQ